MKISILDNPTGLYWASFNRFELRIPGAAVAEIFHPGDAEADVKRWALKIKKQMEKDNFPNKPTPKKIKEELAECGAWNEKELLDNKQNWIRLVWCAACNIAEDDEPDCSEPTKK